MQNSAQSTSALTTKVLERLPALVMAICVTQSSSLCSVTHTRTHIAEPVSSSSSSSSDRHIHSQWLTCDVSPICHCLCCHWRTEPSEDFCLSVWTVWNICFLYFLSFPYLPTVPLCLGLHICSKDYSHLHISCFWYCLSVFFFFNAVFSLANFADPAHTLFIFFSFMLIKRQYSLLSVFKSLDLETFQAQFRQKHIIYWESARTRKTTTLVVCSNFKHLNTICFSEECLPVVKCWVVTRGGRVDCHLYRWANLTVETAVFIPPPSLVTNSLILEIWYFFSRSHVGVGDVCWERRSSQLSSFNTKLDDRDDNL